MRRSPGLRDGGELPLPARARQDAVVSQEPGPPLEAALDLLVYLPVGLALAVGEEVPKLAAKGRARVGGQVAVARMVGRLAVEQGRKEVLKRMGSPAQGRRRPGEPAARPAQPPRGRGGDERAEASREGGWPADRSDPVPAGTVGTPSSSPHEAPAGAGNGATTIADSLAIPGYDSLSASQVVQRLAGLSREELEAVGAYEASGRGRRTILARVAQLQAR